MDYKKYLPKIIVGLVFLIIILVLVDLRASEALPSLLGFLIGGGLTFLLIQKLSKRNR
ncbi:MAG: hypothetical protein ACM3NJ_00290 [Methanobacterium sp.]